MTVRILTGDCRDVLATLDAASVDAVVTDPPYGLTSGKKGGSGVASINLDSPYGRSRIGTGNGQGGFMGQKWDGTGIERDPEFWEAMYRVMKPGAINVDACRIGTGEQPKPTTAPGWDSINRRNAEEGYRADAYTQGDATYTPHTAGRWPSNVILDEEAAAMLDRQSGVLKTHGGGTSLKTSNSPVYQHGGGYVERDQRFNGDTGGASRFFYVAKASRRERGEGNTHPTVKPVALMQWLVRLITPPGGTVLDPFMGSGSTGVACLREGVNFIGIELNPEYAEIARRRITGDAPLFASVEMVGG